MRHNHIITTGSQFRIRLMSGLLQTCEYQVTDLPNDSAGHCIIMVITLTDCS